MTRPSIVSPEDQRVTFVELFFDLVFVFSVTQIVGIFHEGITWTSSGQVVLVFWLVWWAWTQFTWALNAANTDNTSIQFFTLLATAIAFFMAVSVPAAFAGGALWFAVPYVMVRIVGLAVYSWAAASDTKQLTAVQTFALVSVGGLAAVIVGAALGGEALYWLWGLAILLDVIAAAIAGRFEGWNLHAAHFVERHGLIVIIALGESLIVAASGLTAAPQQASLVAVAVVAVALTCFLWWSYFPYLRPALEAAVEEAIGSHRTTMARDAFSLAHFPMLCGIIGIAATIEESIAHPEQALPVSARVALAAGMLLFIGGAALARWRAIGSLPLGRVGLACGTSIAIAVAAAIPSWATLAIGLAGTAAIVFIEHWAAERNLAFARS